MASKRILLITPPRTVDTNFLHRGRVGNIPPLGLLYMGAYMETQGYQVKILDCLTNNSGPTNTAPGLFRFGMADDDILAAIRAIAPAYIGVSCMYTTNYADFASLSVLIKSHWNVPLIAGGAHVTAEWRNVLLNLPVDFVVRGEGEHAFSNLIRCLDSGGDIEETSGIAYRKNGAVRANEPLPFIENLDELPFPAYHLIDFSQYWSRGLAHGDSTHATNWAPIITSRGCPHRCSYCYVGVMSGHKPRLRSVENVMKEIRFLQSTYDVTEIHIEDDNFAHNTNRAKRLLEATADTGVKLAFPTGLSLYSLNNDSLLDSLKRNDVISLTVAIESGDDRILRQVMKKPVTVSLTKRVVGNLRSKGFNVKAFFIVGMPGETIDSLKNTYDLIADLALDWNAFNIASPLPGTQMMALCAEQNFIKGELADDPTKINFLESVIDTPSLDHNQVDKYFYYFNIMTNFVDISGSSRSQQAKEYKLSMYDRIMKQVPHHRYARISASRIKIMQALANLEIEGIEFAVEIDRLEQVEAQLRLKQLNLLMIELSQMPGDISLFHKNSPAAGETQ